LDEIPIYIQRVEEGTMNIVGFPKLFPMVRLAKNDPPKTDKKDKTVSGNCGKGKSGDKGKGKGCM
jgi:hypothetical protein